MKIFGYVVASLLALLLVIWALQGSDFFLTKVFAPKYEQVRRDTFEQSKAYNQGMIQELQNMEFEYVKAAPDQQDALASIILHRAADYDVEKLPPDLRAFVLQLRHNRLTGGK